MLFKMTHKLPNKLWVAVSGGVDSMSALHWLNKGNKVSGVVHVNHSTGVFSDCAAGLVKDYCKDNNISLRQYKLGGLPPPGVSKEAWWRDKRYELFSDIDGQVVLAHNLNDCVEEYVMCMMVRGFRATIHYNHANCIRPFRMWERSSIEEYARRNEIPFVNDPSNTDTKYKRNFIRHKLLPKAYTLNPGLNKLVARLIVEQDEKTKYHGGIKGS